MQARNRFIAANEIQASERLRLIAPLAVDYALSQWTFERDRAGVKAEAAAHWAFVLYPELRVDDEY